MLMVIGFTPRAFNPPRLDHLLTVAKVIFLAISNMHSLPDAYSQGHFR
jgi:hypothetical protein